MCIRDSGTTGLDPVTECTNCVVGGMQDPNPPFCQELAAQCM